MDNNRKSQDETKSKTETIDLSAHTDVSHTGTSARLPRRAPVRVRASDCLKEGQELKMETEDLAKKPKKVFSSGALIPSGENEKETSPSSESKFKILVVDDNENIRDMLEDFLNFEGHKPVLAKDGEEALKLFSEQDFDIVITDLGMPGMSGWELSKHIKQRKPEIPVVIITGWGAQLTAEDLKENKVELMLSKPFPLDQVKQMLERIAGRLSEQ